MHDPSAATRSVLTKCSDFGFVAAGICRAEPTSFERELRDWLAAGKHGEMEYLKRTVQLRIDPTLMVPGAKSIIVVADRYAVAQGHTPSGHNRSGRIAKYAQGDDYHVVMRKRLGALCKQLKAEHPEHAFRACVDTAPVLEREHAQRAGIGAIGKNTLVLQPGTGSYLLLGEVITTLPLTPSQPAEPDPCSTCTRCIDACPTQAITPWSVDATRCISYLTIEHRTLIDERFHHAMGDWIFGCDICQDVCPHNQITRSKRSTQAPVGAAYQSKRDRFDLLDILNWNEESRQQAFLKSSMKRAKLNMLKRNAIIAAANALQVQTDPALLSRIEQLASNADIDAMVRITASQSLSRIAKSNDHSVSSPSAPNPPVMA